MNTFISYIENIQIFRKNLRIRVNLIAFINCVFALDLIEFLLYPLMCKLAKKGNSFDNTRKQWRADSGSGSKYREYSWDSAFGKNQDLNIVRIIKHRQTVSVIY